MQPNDLRREYRSRAARAAATLDDDCDEPRVLRDPMSVLLGKPQRAEAAAPSAATDPYNRGSRRSWGAVTRR